MIIQTSNTQIAILGFAVKGVNRKRTKIDNYIFSQYNISFKKYDIDVYFSEISNKKVYFDKFSDENLSRKSQNRIFILKKEKF